MKFDFYGYESLSRSLEYKISINDFIEYVEHLDSDSHIEEVLEYLYKIKSGEVYKVEEIQNFVDNIAGDLFWDYMYDNKAEAVVDESIQYSDTEFRGMVK